MVRSVQSRWERAGGRERRRGSRAFALSAAGPLVAVGLLAGCGSDSSGDADTSAVAAAPSSSPTGDGAGATGATGAAGGDAGCPQAEGQSVGYSQPIPDPNFAFIEKIMKAELDEHGVTLRTTNANLNPGKQLADIRTLLQGGVDVLVVNPLAPQAIRPALDEARADGIPVVAQESKEGGPFFTNVTADVETAVSEATALMAAAGGPVAAVTAPPLAEVLVRQNTAFDEGAAANGLDVVEKQPNTQISPQGAKQIADTYKQKYGSDLKAVWTFNDTSAVGIASSFGGDFTPELYSINGQPEAIPFVRDGRITATWDLRQDKLGQALAYGALAALCGRQIPSELVIPVTKIDQSNVGSYRPLSERTDDPFDVQIEQRDGRSYVKVGS